MCILGHFVSAYYYAFLSCSLYCYPRSFYCIVFEQINDDDDDENDDDQ